MVREAWRVGLGGTGAETVEGESMTKPTPTLWLDCSERPWLIKDAEGYHVAEMTAPSMDTWGPRIVRAVNSHEALVEACEEMCTWLEGWAETGSAKPAYDKARAALAKARGDDDD